MLFDRTHILYMLISSFITAGLLALAYFFVKTQKGKERVLKIAAIVTVAIHFSSLWVDFFRTGEATVQESMLIPLYPCNICMWLLLIVALWKNQIKRKIKIELSTFMIMLNELDWKMEFQKKHVKK